MNQSFFQDAARLNNDGVTALAEGDTETSIDFLLSTVKLMKRFIAVPQQESSPSPLSNECKAEDEAEEPSSSCFHTFSTVEVSHATCDDQVFFHQAIVMPTDVEDDNTSSSWDAYVYSAAVIFNLALAHHIQGSKDKKAQDKAERLYTTILKLLDERVGHIQSALMLKLACINNLAHIRTENGVFDEARDGASQLSTLLKTTDETLFEAAEVQGLLMSVLLFKKPRVAAAA